MLFYFITLTLKCFVLAVAAIDAELGAILPNKSCKTLQFLCRFVDSAQESQFCARWPILRTQNCRILTSLLLSTPTTVVLQLDFCSTITYRSHKTRI